MGEAAPGGLGPGGGFRRGGVGGGSARGRGEPSGGSCGLASMFDCGGGLCGRGTRWRHSPISTLAQFVNRVN